MYVCMNFYQCYRWVGLCALSDPTRFQCSGITQWLACRSWMSVFVTVWLNLRRELTLVADAAAGYAAVPECVQLSSTPLLPVLTIVCRRTSVSISPWFASFTSSGKVDALLWSSAAGFDGQMSLLSSTQPCQYTEGTESSDWSRSVALHHHFCAHYWTSGGRDVNQSINNRLIDKMT